MYKINFCLNKKLKSKMKPNLGDNRITKSDVDIYSFIIIITKALCHFLSYIYHQGQM